jgi:hypothetical protein
MNSLESRLCASEVTGLYIRFEGLEILASLADVSPQISNPVAKINNGATIRNNSLLGCDCRLPLLLCTLQISGLEVFLGRMNMVVAGLYIRVSALQLSLSQLQYAVTN